MRNAVSAKNRAAKRRVGETPCGEAPRRRNAVSAKRVGETLATKRRVGELSITLARFRKYGAAVAILLIHVYLLKMILRM